jgi:hypothetical protein
MPALALVGSILQAGKKPQVPDWNEVSLGDAAQQAQNTNKEMLPQYEDVAARVNQFNFDQIEQMVRLATPGYDAVQSKVLSNLQSGLRGELPSDVRALVERKAAENAVAGGFGGSGMHRSLEARDLGLTSLQITDRAMSSAESWTARARAYAQGMPMMDVTRMFISPQQQFEANWQNQEAKFNRDWMSNKIAAAPDPTKAAIGQWMVNTDNMIFQTALGVVGGMAGGGMGGMMGGGAKAAPAPAPASPSYSASVAPQASSGWNFNLY